MFADSQYGLTHVKLLLISSVWGKNKKSALRAPNLCSVCDVYAGVTNHISSVVII